MGTRKEFISKAIDKGMSKEQILQAVEARRNRMGAFDDDPDELKKIDVSTQGEKKPVRPFFGLSPKKEKSFFPRAVAAREAGGGPFRTAIPGALDAISIPGRTIAAIPALTPGGETFGESFSRKDAIPKKSIGKVGQFAGDVVRDPISLLSFGAAGGTAKGLSLAKKGITNKLARSIPVTKGIKKAIASPVGRGAIEQTFPALVRQAERSSRTGKVDIPRQVGEAFVEIGSGALGEGVGAFAAKKITPFGKHLLQAAAKTKDVTAKLAGKEVAEGAQKIIEDLVEFNLESPTGGFSKMAQKATKGFRQRGRDLDKVVDGYVVGNPNATIDLDKILNKVKNEIETGMTDIAGNEESKSKFVDVMRESLALRGLTGKIPVAKAREAKQIINLIADSFKKGPFRDDVTQSEKIGRMAFRAVNEEFGEFIPEARRLGQEMRRIKVVEKAMKEAQKRVGNHNFLSLRGSLLLGSGIKSENKLGLFATVAAMLFLKAAEKGRGGSTLVRLGRQKGLPGNLKVIGGESAAFEAEQLQEKLTPLQKIQLLIKQDEQRNRNNQ